MDNLIECCNALEERLNNTRSKDELFEQCARERLVRIYEDENKTFNEMLLKLDTCINYSDFSGVKRCVTKLLKLMNSNRKSLTKALREVY